MIHVTSMLLTLRLINNYNIFKIKKLLYITLNKWLYRSIYYEPVLVTGNGNCQQAYSILKSLNGVRMNRQCLEPFIVKYLDRFYCIFDEMMRGMTGVELNSSISHNFIVQMIPHHRVSIEMSHNILRYTSNKAIQDMASGIITEQTRSIANMEEILDFCCGYENSMNELNMYQNKMNKIMNNMFRRMNNACVTNQINCNFMREMLPHHEGAVKMSETTLKFDICPQLVPILDAIIVSHERGIMQMNNLMKCLGCEQ